MDRSHRRAHERLGTVGIFCFIGSAESAELVASCGVDTIIVDREHTTLGWATVAEVVRAVQSRDVTAIVRVRGAAEIGKALDIGADGILVPRVSTVDDVAACVAATEYPPLGTRGQCTITRGESWGSAAATEERPPPILGILIEDVAGVGNLPAIMEAGDRVDFILVGTRDLSLSMGCPIDAPPIVDALSQIGETVSRHSAPPTLGVVVAGRAQRERWAAQGYSWFVGGIDLGHLGAAVTAMVDQLRGLSVATGRQS